MTSRDQLIEYLSGALNHLYDPDYLRRSPLAALFGVADRFDTPSSLQQILIGAINALEGRGEAPSSWRIQRFHDLLTYLHVQQLTQHEVASLLGISERHVRRERRAALDPLASVLWRRHHLDVRLREGSGPDAGRSPGSTPADSLRKELAWLRDTPVDTPATFDNVLPTIEDLIKPLARKHAVRLEVRRPDELPPLAVHPVALRQVMLNALGAVIPHVPRGQITLTVACGDEWSTAELQIERSGPARGEWSKAMMASLDAARELADCCCCGLRASTSNLKLVVHISFPNLGATPVLVIDDNVDALRLMERYVAGTRYGLHTARRPEQALRLAQQIMPRLIVLDVMMPGLDGFEMLGRLRQHPRLEQVPIVVCTVLDQEALALSLGASAFLKKPITRYDFLRALDCQASARERR